MYVILAIISIVLLVIGIYKIKYQFWSRQPVFHFHNLKYWLVPPGIIQHDKPQRDKYYDNNIFFDSYFNTPTKKKELFVRFIQNHFLPHKNEKYNPPKNAVLNYFKAHNNKSYLSMIHDKNTRKLIGTFSTRPLDCYVENKKLPLYYVDFLCVHQNYRKKGIAPKLIYSHYVNSRNKNKNAVFLFKREGAVTLIVPLTAYKNYMFDIFYWDKLVKFDQPNIRTILINKQCFHHFIYVYERLRTKFKCLIIPNLNHLELLLKDKQIFITVTLIDNEPNDCFIFRNTYTTYDSKGSVECIGSFQETDTSVFVLGFMCSVSLIYENTKFTRLFIENISNNNIIIKSILKRYQPVLKTDASYYFYNFGYRPFESKDVFILN
jgi:GNAT superfamily N-acetyltransferase